MSIKSIFIVILPFLLAGCAKNALGPLPPVTHYETFQDCIEGLQTPAHTAIWLRDFTTYDLNYNLHWGDHNPDQAYTLAKSVWDEYHKGKSRGVCGQFAAFYIVMAREHGYRCGGYVYWTNYYGHAQGWIEEKDGQISITDNDLYYYKTYKSYEHMRDDLLGRNSDDLYGYILDENFNELDSGRHIYSEAMRDYCLGIRSRPE